MSPAHDTGRPHSWHGLSARRGLAVTLGLTATVMLVEVAGGIWANSLALLSDAGHMLTDLLALGMALFAVSVASRPATARRTYGYYRVEILAALNNGMILLVICVVLFYEAWQRVAHPEPVNGGLVLVVASVGLVANLAGMAILSARSGSLNIRAARLHLIGDALSSAGVLAAGGIISLTGWYRVDALMSFAIGVVIMMSAFRLVRETTDILLESTPHGIEPSRVCEAIQAVPGVREVHDLHIWSITSGMTALSGHVKVAPGCLAASDEALNRIKETLRDRFSIEHTTIQLESETYDEVGEVH